MSKLNIASVTKDGLDKDSILNNIIQFGFSKKEEDTIKVLRDLGNQISDELKIDIFSSLFKDDGEKIVRAKLGIKDISNIIQDEVEENKKNFSNAIQDSNIGESIVEGVAESMQSATDSSNSSPITETLANVLTPSEKDTKDIAEEVSESVVEVVESVQADLENGNHTLNKKKKRNSRKLKRAQQLDAQNDFDQRVDDAIAEIHHKGYIKDGDKPFKAGIDLSQWNDAEAAVSIYAETLADLTDKEREAVFALTELDEAQKQMVLSRLAQVEATTAESASETVNIATKQANNTATAQNTKEQEKNIVVKNLDAQATDNNTDKQNENNISVRTNTKLVRDNTEALRENEQVQNDDEFAGVDLDEVDNFLKIARGASDAGKAAEESTKKISVFSKMWSGLTGKWGALDAVSKLKLVGGAIGGIALAASVAYESWKKYKAKLVETATETTETWNSSQKSIEDYSEKYKELKTQLDSGNLSESETIDIKKQILDVQQQIVEQYGAAADNLDLINGKLDTQLGKIKEISEVEAERLLRDADKGYKDAKKEMEDKRTYIVGSIALDDDSYGKTYSDASDRIKQLVKQYENLHFGQYNGHGYEIEFTGDASQADEVLYDFSQKLKALQEEFGADNVPFIESILDAIDNSLAENDDILEKYAENYKTYLELMLFKDGKYDEVEKYAEAVDNYNTALHSGKTAEIEEAKKAYEEAQVAKDKFLAEESKNNGEDYSPLFGDFDAQVDTATEKYHEFTQKILNGDGKERFHADQLKSMRLSSQDVRNALVTNGEQQGENFVRTLADAYGITDEDIQKNSSNLQAFLDILVKFGIVIDGLNNNASKGNGFKSFFEVFTSADFKDAKESLLELAKAGELSPKILESTEEYKKLLKQTGLKADEAKDKILGLLTTQQKLAGTSQGLDSIKTAYQEAFNKDIGFVTAETLESLPDVFKDLDGYDFNLFKSIVGNTNSTKKEMQQAFNDIVTAYVNSQGVIESVMYGTEDEAQSVIDNLSHMGVSNAKEVIENARNSANSYNMMYAKTEQAYIAYLNSTNELQQAQLAGADKNHLDALKKKLDDDETYYNNLVSANQDVMLKEFGQDYLDDYKNWCDTLSAKASAYNEYIREYMEAYEKEKAMGNTMASPDPFWQEHHVLGSGTKVPLLNVNYNKGLKLNLGGKTTLEFDDPKLLDGVNDSSKEKSEETFDWIERAIQKVQRTVTNLGKVVDATYKKWSTRNSKLAEQISAVNKEISVQKQAYQAYMAEANAVGLDKTYKELVQNGKMDIQTIKDEKLAEKIQKYQDYYDKAIQAYDAAEDLEAELASLGQKQFDHVVSEYENKLSTIEHEVSMIDGMISQVETRGYMVSTKYYGELIEKEQSNLSTLQAEYNTLNKALAEAMSVGNIEKYSESWYEMTGQINDVEKAIQDSNTALIEYQNSIRDLRWESFDKMMEMMGEIQEESDFLRELMSEHKLFNDKGGITDKGQATLGLHTVDYNSHMAMADEYAKELLGINKDLAKDPNNLTLLERRNELLDAQRESILAAQKEKQTIKDLYKEGYDAVLSHMDDIISKRKELNSLEKDALDYQKDIEEQTKEVASLEKQLKAYGADDSEETKAAVQKIKLQLEEAKDNLEQTQYDRFISDQEQMYDTLRDETENFFNARLDNIDGLLQSAIDSTNANAESIKETLSNEAAQVGTTLSEAMNGIWSAGGTYASVVDVYQQNFSALMTTTNNILSDIKETLQSMVDASDKMAESSKPVTNTTPSTNSGTSGSETNSSSGNSQSSISTSSSSSNKDNESSSSAKWGSWFISKKYKGDKNNLNKSGSLVDRLRYFDFDESFSARKQYYTAMGLGSDYTGTAQQNKEMVNAMKSNGFAKGGTIGSLIKGTGEDGFVLARTGEEILSLEKIKQLQEVFNTISPISSSIQHLPNIRAMTNSNGSYEINIGDIQMYGVNDPETFALQLKDNLLHNQAVKKIIQADTLGAAMGKNSFTKFNY